MVKKAKKAKKVAKSRNAKSVTTKRKATVTVPMQTVVQFVKMLVSEGRDVEFEQHAKSEKASVTLGKGDVEFVKGFLARNDHLRPLMARSVREPCPGNPFEC